MVTETAPKSIRGLSSIRTQLILGFGLILALLLITTLISYLSLQSFQTEVEATLNQAAQIRELSLEIENEFLLARQSEAEFLSSWQSIGLESAKASYLSDTQAHLAEARLKLVKIEALAQDIADEELRHALEDTAALKTLLDAYESSLLTTVDLIERRSQADGVELNMREQLDDLDRIVEPLPNPQLFQLILQMRADEQGFFNSGLQQYIDNILIRTKRFTKLVEASSPTDLTVDGKPVEPADLVARAESYLASFNELFRLEQQIDTNTTVFQDITGDINEITSRIGDKGAEGLARAQLRLDAISRQTTIALIVAAALAFGLGVIIVIILVRRIVGPLNQLTQVAEQIGQGDYIGQVNVPRQDEFGLLADAFNAMTVQLRNFIDTLEERVTDRTQRLEIVAALSERLTAILDFDQLLLELVNQVKESFDYYHTHIYIIDEERQNLVMAVGVGEAGAQMKAKGHSIPLDAPTSLVARAARSGEIVSVDNVREAEDWLPNPLLPDTYSEMAVPIVLDERVVGVLDVQEDEVAGLDEGDANLLRSLANQVAVAIRNARLFEQVETALAEARAAQERYFEQSWDKIRIAPQSSHYLYAQPGAAPLDESKLQALTEVQQQALTQDHLAVVRPNADDTEGISLLAPVMLGDRTIGALQLHTPGNDQTWAEDDLTVIEAVVDQLAQTAENLRLFEETRERANYEQLVGEITQKLRQAPTLEALAKTASEELSNALGVSHSVVKVGVTSGD